MKPLIHIYEWCTKGLRSKDTVRLNVIQTTWIFCLDKLNCYLGRIQPAPLLGSYHQKIAFIIDVLRAV